MHIEEQTDDREQIQDCKDYQCIEKESGPAIRNSLDKSTVTAQLRYEIQKKLILPFKFLNSSSATTVIT